MADEPTPTPDRDPDEPVDPENDPGHDRGLTPAQEQRVRRLLADARHSEPMPGDVAARLDRVLADLAAGEAPPPVVPLAARRRRRAVTMLVAAAAVVAVGVGLAQLVRPDGGSSASSSADSAMTSDIPDSGRDVSRSPGAGASSASGAIPEQRNGPDDPGAGMLDRLAQAPEIRVRPGHFSRDVTRARRIVVSRLAAHAAADDRSGHDGAAVRPGFVCEVGNWGRGRAVPVHYGQRHAVLVLRPVTGDTQVVDLFRCGGSEVLRSITLPAP